RAPAASRPASVPWKRPPLPRRGQPSLGARDLACVPRDAPDGAPLAARAGSTEVVPSDWPSAGPTAPQRGDAGVDSAVRSRDPPVGVSADPRGTVEARPSGLDDRDPDPSAPPRTGARPAAGRRQLAGVPTPASGEHPGLRLLYGRDGVAQDTLRPVLH